MNLTQLERLGRRTTLALYGLLLVSLTLNWLANDSAYNNLALLLLQLVPLLLFLPGIIRKNARAHIWFCVLLLVYATKAMVNLVFSDRLLFDLLETFSAIALFFSALYYVRWNERLKKAAVPASPE